MTRVKFTTRALLHVLAEYIMIFPLFYLISGLMTGMMPVVFLVSVLLYAILGVLIRQFIPVPWLQLVIGLPLCVGAAIYLGLTFGSRAEPTTYAFPALLAPFIFYRGKQHAQNDWNVILPTYAPYIVMALNFVVMALVNYLNLFSRFMPVMAVAGPLSLVTSFYAMNYINRRNLADDQRTREGAATAISHSLAQQNNILLVILLAVGALLSCMPWLLTAGRYLLKAASFIIGLLVNLLLSLVPPLSENGGGAPEGETPLLASTEVSPFWESFSKILANIVFVIIIVVFVFLVILAIRKGVKLLSAVFRHMLQQKGLLSDGDDTFEDTRETIVNLRDLPRKYLDSLKKKLSELRRGKRWNELTTESERVRYLYRHSLKRAAKSGYQHKASYTPHEALGSASQELPQIQSVQDDLAATYDLVRYAEREPSPGDAERIKGNAGL